MPSALFHTDLNVAKTIIKPEMTYCDLNSPHMTNMLNALNVHYFCSKLNELIDLSCKA